MLDEADIRRGLREQLETRLQPRWRPLPHQVPPPGNWYGWILLGGRGSGKTDAGTSYMNEHALGPPCLSGPVPHWMSIIAPTQGDAVTSCFYGPSGLRAHNPSTRLVVSPGGLVIRWPNGAEAKMFGAHTEEEIDRLRAGGNRCFAFLEELAAWRYLQEAWDHMRFGLRVGPRPHWLAATTPKPRTLIKRLDAGLVKNVVISRATISDNPHLPENLRTELMEEYQGTRLGAQELEGRLLDEDPDALWRRSDIETYRVDPDDLPQMRRVTVGVDPSGGAGEQGIVVVGRHDQHAISQGKMITKPHGYVLADRSCRLSASGWGNRAVMAAVDWEADDICVEINYGGDMAAATVRGAADVLGHNIPVRIVHASRGKRVRAEPVSALSERGQWHHAGIFGELEDQQCNWTPELDWSPDRLDAMVWGAWHSKLVSVKRIGGRGSYPGSAAASVTVLH